MGLFCTCAGGKERGGKGREGRGCARAQTCALTSRLYCCDAAVARVGGAADGKGSGAAQASSRNEEEEESEEESEEEEEAPPAKKSKRQTPAKLPSAKKGSAAAKHTKDDKPLRITIAAPQAKHAAKAKQTKRPSTDKKGVKVCVERARVGVCVRVWCVVCVCVCAA